MKKDEAIDELSFLFNQYVSHLPNKIDDIETSANNLFTDWNEEKYMNLLRIVHGLNGSAALYCYNELHELAKKMESKLQSLNEPALFNAEKDYILNTINQFKTIIRSTIINEKFQLFLQQNLQGIQTE